MRFFIVLLGFTVFMAASARAEVTVYELFTARNCPSCPPADALFREVARSNPDVIALSCHVTYFDRPGRTDSLGAEFCDGRQTGYRQSRVLPQIFTPAGVINGDQAIKSSDADSLISGLRLGKSGGVQKVHLSVQDGYLNVMLPSVPLSAAAEVWLFAYDSGHAVRFLTKLMSWNGKPVAMAFPVQNIPAAGYAVIAQTAIQTEILAAGKTN
ncbi:MAG: DUF1223 domain-containing protein [Alphaproteobacteria bacterium]